MRGTSQNKSGQKKGGNRKCPLCGKTEACERKDCPLKGRKQKKGNQKGKAGGPAKQAGKGGSGGQGISLSDMLGGKK